MRAQKPPGKGANADPAIRLMRRAQTDANNRYGIGGVLKRRPAAAPGMPKLKCLDDPSFADGEGDKGT